MLPFRLTKRRKRKSNNNPETPLMVHRRSVVVLASTRSPTRVKLQEILTVMEVRRNSHTLQRRIITVTGVAKLTREGQMIPSHRLKGSHITPQQKETMTKKVDARRWSGSKNEKNSKIPQRMSFSLNGRKRKRARGMTMKGVNNNVSLLKLETQHLRSPLETMQRNKRRRKIETSQKTEKTNPLSQRQ